MIIILLPLFLCGCVSYTELNELGIIDMILIDKDDDKYAVEKGSTAIDELIPSIVNEE